MARGAPDFWRMVFSNFPTLGEGQIPWFQSDTALVGDDGTEDLINYVVPDDHELHVCSGVVSCGMPRLQRYDLRTTPAGTWVSPTSHLDPDSKWQDPENAYDGNTATRALNTILPTRWGNYLHLLINAVNIDKVRYFVKYHAADISKIDVDVFYEGDWQDVYEGIPADEAWEERDIPAGTKLVSKARVRFYNSKIIDDIAHFWEFAFNTAAVTPQEGTYFDTHAIIPYLPQAPYLVGAGATFAVRVYNDDDADQTMSVALAGFLQKKV